MYLVDSCCTAHDICYDSLQLNQTFCDEIFCHCLNNIDDSIYCKNIAHPGLCLATHVFGHMFHWSSNCTGDSSGECILTQNISINNEENSQNIQGVSFSSIKDL